MPRLTARRRAYLQDDLFEAGELPRNNQVASPSFIVPLEDLFGRLIAHGRELWVVRLGGQVGVVAGCLEGCVACLQIGTRVARCVVVGGEAIAVLCPCPLSDNTCSPLLASTQAETA
jgi:hypothetical protein